MNTKVANEYFYNFLSKYKAICLGESQIDLNRLFPDEVVDLCIIIYWRYRKLNSKLKKYYISKDELRFMEDNSFINTSGEIILPPIEIRKNNHNIYRDLTWFLHHEYRGNWNNIHNELTYYMYFVAVNPLLIESNKMLVSLIVKIAKKAMKYRDNRLQCLRVYDKNTGLAVLPFDNYLSVYVNYNIFDTLIHKK